MGGELLHPITEQCANVVLVAPQRRRLDAGRRGGDVRLHGRERLADEPLGRPADHADPAARLADPDQFIRRQLVMRREHHTDAGQHRVELVVGERHFRGVRFLPLQRHTALGGDRLTCDEQLGGQIARHDGRSRLRGRNGNASGARGHVEYTIAGADTGRLDEHRAKRGHHVSWPAGPAASSRRHTSPAERARFSIPVRALSWATMSSSRLNGRSMCHSGSNPYSSTAPGRMSALVISSPRGRSGSSTG